MTDPSSPPQPLPATAGALTKILDRKPVLWIGPGLSIAAGYPAADRLVKEIAAEADDSLDTAQPFFAVADAFVASTGRGQLADLIQRHFRAPRAPTAAHRALARLAGAGCFHAVVTTNHDTLLERALDEYAVPYIVQPAGEQQPITGGGPTRILKLEGSHGDWLRIVLSGRAHADFGSRYPFLEEHVDALLRQRPVLFVGSALDDQRVLRWIARLSEEEAASLYPWRALLTRIDWDAALAQRYQEEGVMQDGGAAILRAHIRPLLLGSDAELPGLLAEVADAVAPAPPAGPATRLRELSLLNYRGFEDFHLTLPEEAVAVFIGANGAGKSSVLDAIARILEICAANLSPGLSLRDHEIGDIREGTRKATIIATVDFAGETQQWKTMMYRPINLPSITWEDGPSRDAAEGSSGMVSDYSGYPDPDRQRFERDPSASVPVMCCYPVSRALPRTPVQIAAPKHLPSQLHAYDQAFDNAFGPFRDFVRWFRLEEDLENEAQARGGTARNPRLKAVRSAVERFMNALPGGRFSNLRAERGVTTSHLTASLVIDKAGQRLALSQLSDGERTLLLLVADIARRLAIANPGLPDALLGFGIILIDEIDLHLHPSWQRAVLPGLRRAFPGLQIIAATHSPQVLSRLPAESVILLENFQIAGASPPTYGRDTNSILEEVMSVPSRPEEIASRLQEISTLIDEERLEEAQAQLDEITARLGGPDAEVVRLGTMIEFLKPHRADSEP